LREVARVIHKQLHSLLGIKPDFTVEDSVPWRGANEVDALRLSIKEAEASRDEIIEECAKVADAYAKEHWGHTEEEHAAEKITELLRALKSSPSTPKSPKNDCQGEDPVAILKEALKQASSYIDSTPLMPGNSYKEIKAVIRAALECDSEGTGNG
jgi:hypothetical protein